MRSKTTFMIAAAALILCVATSLKAQSAEDIAKALQDPLANVSMLVVDNGINFKIGAPDSVTGYMTQLQPVYAFSFEKFNFIPRAVIPIMGVPTGAYLPILGDPVSPTDGLKWGLSDIMLQGFFNIKSESAWKIGFGPQFSLKTRSDSLLAGPGWGAGAGVVVVGGFGDKLSTTLLLSQHWNFDGDFSLLSIQPTTFYNLPGAATIHYNNTITFNSKASEGNEWLVPLGAGLSKTFLVGGGHAIDLAVGYYYMAVRPEGGPHSQAKFALTWVIPR